MSKVHRVITKKRLMMGLPADYAIFSICIIGVLYLVLWYTLKMPKIWEGWHVYTTCGLVSLILWGFGYIKAGVDAEFLGVHLAKLSIPAQSISHQIKRYLSKIEIEP